MHFMPPDFIDEVPRKVIDTPNAARFADQASLSVAEICD